MSYAFTGALLGSLVRPVGGRLADRFGGARVTFVNFAAMVGALALVWQGVRAGSVGLFFGAYLLLIATSGVGNGSTYRMIPAIFRVQAVRGISPSDETAYGTALAAGRRDAAAAIGFISAIGAFGGFFINRGFGSSIAATGSVGPSIVAFAVFYVICLVLTWFCYMRTVGVRLAPSLAAARP